MTTKKYFYDQASETLTVVEVGEEGAVLGINELSDPYILEYEQAEGSEGDEEDETIEEVQTPPRKPRLCGKCGQPGHQARTCPNGMPILDEQPVVKRGAVAGESLADIPTRDKFPVIKPLRQQIAEQKAEGVTLEEIYELFPDVAMAEITAVYQDLERE